MEIYKAYATNDVTAAVEAYCKKTGVEPTIIVVRPGYSVVGAHPALIESRHGAFGLMLVSHLLTDDEIEYMRQNKPRSEFVRHKPPALTMSHVDLEANSAKIQRLPQGRPKHGGGTCPHCQQHIIDFNVLGFWWGWAQGIEPPYWEDLRLFVFRRDAYRCYGCGDVFGMSGLQCHHIEPKETGGSDSARNLRTLCKDCHIDIKPIMAEEVTA